MSEVKVRITAQNETQTGFQAVLSDAKKTASEVKKTFSQTASAQRAMQPQQAAGGKPFSFEDFYDDAIRKAEQQIEANLAKRKAAREAAAQAEKAANGEIGNSIMSLVGRFAMLAGAAVTVGKVISMAFEQVSDAFKSAAETSKQLGAALQQAGSAMSSGGSLAGFQQINSLADQLERTRDETYGTTFGRALATAIQGRPGQLGARLADVALMPFGMSGSSELTAQSQQAREQARAMLIGSLSRQSSNAQDLLAAGGNSEALKKLQTEQQNAAEIAQAIQAIDPGKSKRSAEDIAAMDKAIALIKQRQAAEGALAEQIKQRQAFEATDQLAKTRQESGMTNEQLLVKERAALASIRAEAQKSGGMSGEAILEREKTLQRIQALEKSITSEREKQAAANREIDQRFSDAQASKERSAAQDRQNFLKATQRTLNNRRFQAMSPEEQQNTVDQSVAAFEWKKQKGLMTPQQATEEAARLFSMIDATGKAPAGFQGSSGASAFQRVGFAANEFFDTRQKENPTKAAERAAKAAERVAKALESMTEPLVLNPTKR